MSHAQQFNPASSDEQRFRPSFFTPHAVPTLGRGNSAPASLHGMVPANPVEPNTPQPATPDLENLTLSSDTASTTTSPGCVTPASSAADEYFWEQPLETRAKDAAPQPSNECATLHLHGEPKPSVTFYSGDHELGYPHRNPRLRSGSVQTEIDPHWTVSASDIIRRSVTGSAKPPKSAVEISETGASSPTKI